MQIKGRGTRTYSFGYKHRNDFGELEETRAKKKKFKIFDFFANFEYFEEKYDYDQVLELPKVGTGDGGGDGGIDINILISHKFDPLKTLATTEVGPEGMRVDREFFGDFAETVKQHDFVVDKVEQGDFKAAEDYVREKIFDKPKEYYNLQKLRKSAQVDRRLTLREILERIFDLIPRFKSKDELLEDEFDKFVSVHKPEVEYVLPIKNFLKAYITDSTVREIIEKKEYALFATSPVQDDFRALSSEWRKIVPEYIKDYVSLNTYM